jgi:peroxiredoxin/ribosomal protein S18 acetylase RimI-like enzyme
MTEKTETPAQTLVEGQAIAFADDLRKIEAAAVNAWPTLETIDIDGWHWRYAKGGSQRSNSVSTLNFVGADLDAAIDAVEARYQDAGAQPLFQITSVSEPAGLDQRLAERGYHRREPCQTMIKSVAAPAHFGVMPDLTGVEWTFEPSAHWIKTYQSVLDETRKAAAPAIIDRLPRPRAFFLYRKRGISFATALAINEDGMIGIECLATREEGRRRGAARALMTGVEVWAQKEGAHTLYLQVRANNVPALNLYRSLGYEAVGTYHYRAKALVPAEGQPPLAIGQSLPVLPLAATTGAHIDVSALPGRVVLFVYPYTGQSGVADPPGWDDIAGAHGSTPQAIGFRDQHAAFAALGVQVFGLSGQDSDWQREAVSRLSLPFPLLNDDRFEFADALALPTFMAGDRRFHRRLTLILNDGRVERCLYPVDDPAGHAADVLGLLG